MASITTESNGHRRIQFFGTDGTRKTLRLGKCDLRSAQQVCRHVETLAASKIHGQPLSRETCLWLTSISDMLHQRIVKTGLVDSRICIGAKLKKCLEDLVNSRNDLKPASKVVFEHVISDMVQFWTAERDIKTITPGDADNFKQYLIGRKLAATTISKRLHLAKSFFKSLKRRKLIDENPFEDVHHTATGIKDRQRFISQIEARQVLQACPNHHWRAIVALSRYGGLRCPSEVLSLKWTDVNWELGRVLVHSPKTERFANKASRLIPLFPELKAILLESQEKAEVGSVYVVDERYRKSSYGKHGWKNANLRTTFRKIIERAGLVPWPRVFHNMRASRETELVEHFPIQTVTAWLGNTPDIAMQHYLMITEDHFQRAIKCPDSAAQNAAQQLHESTGNGTQTENPEPANRIGFPGVSELCQTVLQLVIGEEGIRTLVAV